MPATIPPLPHGGSPTLLVLLGPTAVGKTALSLALAERLGAPIVSADSRQMFRGMEIGTAAPTREELARAPHHFVGTLAPDRYYSAARYEQDALRLLSALFRTHPVVILTGGSMLYLDAVCRGIDNIPTVDDEVRTLLRRRLEEEGLDALLAELRLLDPQYYARCDLRNTRRVVHALEVCYTGGRPYSAYCTGQPAARPWRTVKVGLQRSRDDLFARINSRAERMVAGGLIDEARRLSPYRHCNALNTVGYKEAYRYLDGEWTLREALDKIARNTRVYAKKQMTWFRRDADVQWLDAESATAEDVASLLNEGLGIRN
ncbi:MAG: tRNA (adenosine(37)-N6)-dimethylallyltransferase MiaA [Bacteroidaceae bacterium]|nr:tRNA (adenosine(37)-N6)-dimethylallyltransferase MiaA [Bacteroidaceae bacterium]